MHKCLQSPEIFHHILEFVLLLRWRHDDHDPSELHNHLPTTNPALAALARTCRDFLEPTLDVLWRNQLTLGPLALLLPADAIYDEVKHEGHTSTHYLSFTRPLVASDLSRFYYYAERITSFGYFLYEFADQDTYLWNAHNFEQAKHLVNNGVVWQLCLLRKQPSLLPRLRRLRWTAHDIPYTGCLPLFMSPHLTTLSFAFYPHVIKSDPTLPNSFCDFPADILDSALDLCPSLTSLEIQPAFGQKVIDAAIRFAFACKGLVGFIVSGARSSDLVRYLAGQESLRQVNLIMDEEMIENLPSLANPTTLSYPFPSLDTLMITTPTLASVTTLIMLMGQCKLRQVHLAYEAIVTSVDLHNLFLALNKHCSRGTLQKVYIECIKPLEERISRSAHSLTIDILSPLLVFSNMLVVTLRMPMYGAIHDEDLALMADSWPRLLELCLMEGWKWFTASSVTWAGIAYLAWRCPMLETLTLALDMTVENVAEVTSREGFRPNTRLHSLETLDSAMHDVTTCALSLYVFAPCLFEFCGKGIWEVDDEGNPLPMKHDPMTFYAGVTDILYDLQRRAHRDEDEIEAPRDPAKIELSELNPWGWHE